MSYVSFSARIKTLMNTVSEIESVYDYEPQNPTGFPFCSIVPTEGSDETEDSCSNETKYNFSIKIFDDLAGDTVDREEVETRMRTLGDTVLEKFREKTLFQLEGGHFFIAKNNGFKYIEREGGFARVFEITLEIRQLNDLT